jgi:cytoskeleton protein RodZ
MTSASNTSQAAPAGKSAAPEAAPPKPAVAKSAPQPAAAPAAKPVQKPKPVHTVAGDRSRLVLATSAPSWVDIRDSNNTRLLYETVAANRTISVEGEPPFQVFIGNAAAVTLSYDGKTIDVQSHQNGPTARFTVGATAGDNKVAD